MQITTDQLTAEAARMALELRFKDQAIAALEAEVKELREKAAEHDGEDDADEAGDGEGSPARRRRPAPEKPA